MVRIDDLEELAQVLTWGDAADELTLFLSRLEREEVRLDSAEAKKYIQKARQLVDEVTRGVQGYQSHGADRVTVHASAARTLADEHLGSAVDLGYVEAALESLRGAEDLAKLRDSFDQIGSAMHRAALELSSRRPAWQL